MPDRSSRFSKSGKMAHEAVVSLNMMIESFLNIPKYRNIFLPIPETESIHEEVWSLKSILELDHFTESEELNALKGEIVMIIPKFRDVLKDHINKCLLLFPESQNLGGGSSNELIFSQYLEKVKKEMISFVETMKKINNEYNAKDRETRRNNEALVSLTLIIENFLTMPYFNNFHLIRETTKLVQQEVWSLKSILELDHFKKSERFNALKGEILEAIPKFRDVLEDYINKCLLLFLEPQSLGGGSSNELIFSQYLEKVKKEMISFVETMKKIKVEYESKDLETSNNESPLADPDEVLVSLTLIIETESFLNMPYFNNFHLIQETEIVHEEVLYLKSVLELDQIHFKESEILNALKGEIVMTIPKFRDVLQDYINKCQLLFSESQSLDDESRSELIFYQDLEKVKKEIISFVETMKKINKEYNAKLDPETSNKKSTLADEDFCGNAKDMVGIYDEDLQQLIHKFMRETSWLSIIPVVGIGGIGKTTIVKALYTIPGLSDCFDLRAFIKVGPDYHRKDILLDLLVCLSPNYNKILGIEKSEEELKKQIHKTLFGISYLIVLDDLWDMDFWDYIRMYLPYDNNKCRIIFTTRLLSLACNFSSYGIHKIRFRNEEESWNLFCRKVFVEDSCPPELKKVGKKIVKRCGGLPLGIISIASILSKAEKKLDYWEKVAETKNFLALATDEGSRMSESLFLSYKHLPPHLKECCLYFGVFPLDHEISISKLVKLWVGEGLVQQKHIETFEDTAREYLEDLVSHNIVLVRQQSSNGKTKTCSAHYFFWHLYVISAAKKNIFHVINSYPSAFSEGIHYQRRLCIHMNALLGFKCVSKSIESVSNVRSFLCTGPEHQYPVSICSSSKSIKVLDALTIRLYKFPIGILELVELKYLAFTYDGKLPSSISRLKNLVYLIVHRYHLKIINSSPSYMPIEIWNMQELRHLQVMGSDLPHPVDGAQLPNLLTLQGVSDRSCTKEVLQCIPNLEKLVVQIVLPQGVYETFHIFDHLALLSRLKSFKCIVSNPSPRSQCVILLPESVFPSSLTKLTLSGCGFAWKDMEIIGALKYLRVLKLRCYAFQGPEWVVDEEEFPELEYLLLEDTDLVKWKVGYGCFPQLKRLIIRNCYKLEEISNELGELIFLEVIELVDCPSAMTFAKHIQEKPRGYYNTELQILQVYSSLDDQKH